MRDRWVWLLVAGLLLAVLTAPVSAAPLGTDDLRGLALVAPVEEQATGTPPLPVVEVLRRVAPSVVQVHATVGLADDPSFEESWGSGVRIGDGVVTADHVVGDARRVEIVTADGRRGSAVVARRAALLDLVLLKPDLSLPVLEMEPARGQLPGATVLTVGYSLPDALGPSTGPTLTSGVVSAIRQDQEGLLYVQTDAALDPGASGGALVNLGGRLVGLPAFGVARSQAGNFAIASEVVQQFLLGPPPSTTLGGPTYAGDPLALLLTEADLDPTWTLVDDEAARGAESPLPAGPGGADAGGFDAERLFFRGDPAGLDDRTATLLSAARIRDDADQAQLLWERAVRRPPPGYLRRADPPIAAACRAFEHPTGPTSEIDILCREENVVLVLTLYGPRDTATLDAAAYLAGIVTERVRSGGG